MLIIFNLHYLTHGFILQIIFAALLCSKSFVWTKRNPKYTPVNISIDFLKICLYNQEVDLELAFEVF